MFSERIIYVYLLFLSVFFSYSIQADEWNRVYLATYPRSGNHWIRLMIEEATGIATSSVYRECHYKTTDLINTQHSEHVFPWIGHCTENGYTGTRRYPEEGDIVIVKTHFPLNLQTKGDLLNSSHTLRIVRHPIDSFYSYYIYHPINKPHKEIVPHNVVLRSIKEWKKFNNYYNDQETITVRYEDLLDNQREVFSKLMMDIGYSVSDEDIERAVNRYLPKNYELQHLNHFTKEDIDLIREELKDLMNYFGYEL